jgi:hypothetical protein
MMALLTASLLAQLLVGVEGQVDPKYGVVKTLYHECIPDQCSDIADRNTADEAGDTGFVIKSIGTNSSNPEMDLPYTYVSQHIVQVDTRFSGYQCCNRLKCKCCAKNNGTCDSKRVGWKWFKKQEAPQGSFLPVTPWLKRFGLWHADLEVLNTTSCPSWAKHVVTGQSDAAWVSTTAAAKKAKTYHMVKHVKSIHTSCMVDVMIAYVDKIGKKDCIKNCKQKIPSKGVYNPCCTKCFKDLWCKIPMDDVTETWAMALGTLAGADVYLQQHPPAPRP